MQTSPQSFAHEFARTKSRAQLWHQRERDSAYRGPVHLILLTLLRYNNEQQMDITQGVYLGNLTVSSYFSFKKDQEAKQALVDTLYYCFLLCLNFDRAALAMHSIMLYTVQPWLSTKH